MRLFWNKQPLPSPPLKCEDPLAKPADGIPTSPLVALQQISLTVNRKQILHNIDLAVNPQETVTIIGPNGAGKTSLLRVILGVIPPSEGKVWIQPGLKIAYVPQKAHINASLPITVERFLTLNTPNSTVSYDEHLHSLLGIASILSHPISTLSGGEWQRVLLTRAILRKPDLLVLDEPDSGVDVQGLQSLYTLLANIRTELGCSLLTVSHNLHLVMSATDRVICINGHICCAGSPAAVSSNPEYARLFGNQQALSIYAHQHDHSH